MSKILRYKFLREVKGKKSLNSQQKAELSQRIVADFLRENRFVLSEVNNPSANGIDIVAIKNNKHFLIEVKSVFETARSWRVKKIHPKSDYVAVVMPNGKIHFESATDWLKLTDSTGSRSITSLVHFYQLL